ncbi:MAG: FAD-dependent oxidoreductase [Thermosynechococcaceae cyanobacterium]
MEQIVAHVQDWPEGQMQQVAVGETEILLAKVNGKFYAVGANCSHYGAPLVQGVLKGDRIACPWHHACFKITTGDQLEPPGLDALPQFEVRVENDAVMVRVPESAQQQRTPTMAKHQPETDARTFVILGAGAAGSAAAEMLRQQGFQGRVVMITGDRQLPYDRTLLSKAYLQGQAESAPLRSADFYQQAEIEVWTGQTVTHVEPDTQTLTVADGSTLNYDKLLLATGGKARRLTVPGADLDQILTLRQFADAEQILSAAESAQHIVIVGSSFIGMEAAASLAKDHSITVVSRSAVPFEKTLGKAIGQMFQQGHETNGVQFRLGTQVKEFKGNGKVTDVVLDSGESLPADLVILGIGVEPATDYLSDIDLNDDGSIPVNEYLQVTEHLYAAGDIAQFPNPQTGQPTRIEHWRLAAQHGRIAACNMLGQNVVFKGVPFFWTGQFDLKLRYAGHAEDWDEIVIQGNLSEYEFLAFYIKADRVLAVAGCGCDREMAAITELMRLDQLPSPGRIQTQSMDWLTHLQAQPLCSSLY